MPICTCPVCRVVNPRGLDVSRSVKHHHEVEARTKAIRDASKAAHVGHAESEGMRGFGNSKEAHIGTPGADAGTFVFISLLPTS